MSNKIRNPQPGGGPDIVIPKLGWLFLGCSIGFYYVAWEFIWLSNFCFLCGNFTMILAIGCLGYWLWIHKNELKFKYYGSTNNLNLKIVESRSMKNFLAKSNITVNSNDSRYKEVPKLLIEKDGLKIEAIGNLRDKLFK